jgi:transposase-like protein
MTEKYRAEFKAECVALVIEKKYTLQAAANEMEVPSSSISGWVQAAKKSDKMYIQQLEEDVSQLTKENQHLRKININKIEDANVLNSRVRALLIKKRGETPRREVVKKLSHILGRNVALTTYAGYEKNRNPPRDILIALGVLYSLEPWQLLGCKKEVFFTT